MTSKLNSVLDALEQSKRRFGDGDRTTLEALRFLAKAKFNDAEELIRFHEALLFFRAYPPSSRVLNVVDANLKKFDEHVSTLQESDADLSSLDAPEVSGITRGSVTSNFSYPIVRWLAATHPSQLSIDWEWFEEEERFGANMPRFIPLLDEEAMVEAHVPYRDYLRLAKGRANEVVWLVERFESLQLSQKERAERFDSLKIHVRWDYRARASRTAMKLGGRPIFFHDRPLISRRDVSLVEELKSKRIEVRKLSPAAGKKILEISRVTSAVRYRELHGFTFGNPRQVLKATLGRGIESFRLRSALRKSPAAARVSCGADF
jgi:hypothetical protein